jgi:tRNA pseudouridine38-40 synthase
MRNILLTIRFDGTAYHGWQVQENGITVQQTLQDAWEKITGSRDNVTGCSRTDSGVHANKYCCNIRTENTAPCDDLVYSLNAVLPDDIGVTQCREVNEDFHATYDCVSKEYIYRIWNSPVKNPFEYKYSLRITYPLDEQMLDRQAKQFIGRHDFSAFCASGSSVADTVRTVTHASVTRQGDMVIFRVEADGFLYNMVRIMAGTLLGIASGKIPEDTVTQIIESGDRNRAGITAKPYGLFLNDVKYAKE